MKPSAARLLAVLALAVWGAPRAAHADELTLITREYGSWDAAVSALRASLVSEGTTLHVAVSDFHGTPVPCDRYVLQLDPETAAAFRVGTCDRPTFATELVLFQRAALFDHSFAVARPRTLTLGAIETLRGTAVARGGPVGGSALQCSVAVRPYLDDPERGTRVMLTPGRYTLRPLNASVSASPDGVGWSLSTTQHASVRIEYDVIDVSTNEVVLHEQTTLACDSGPADAYSASIDAAAATCTSLMTLLPDVTMQGSTTGSDAPVLRNTCGAMARSREYRLFLAQRSSVTLTVASDYDGNVAILRGCGADAQSVACNDDAGDTRHSRLDQILDPGVYTVRVGAYVPSGTGSFNLLATVVPVQGARPAMAWAPTSGGDLRDGSHVTGSTVGRMSEHTASCAAGASSPDVTYRLAVVRRSHLVLRLSSNYDGALILLRNGQEVACNDDDGDAAHSRIEMDVDSGLYEVVVDGFSSGHSGTYALDVSVQPR